MTTRKYHSAVQRRCHVREWQHSGLSKNVYALQHDLNIKTFGNWTCLPREKPADAASPDNNAFIIAVLASLIRELNLC